MNTEINQAMAQFIAKALDGVNSAVAFGKIQLPEVIEQLIKWKIAQYCILSVVSIIAIVLIGVIAHKVHKKYSALEKIDRPELTLPYLLLGASALFFALLLISRVLNLVEISVAPKAWLIEYAAQIVKG